MMENTNEKRLADFWPVMKEQLDNGRTVQFKPNGNSMLPLLRPGVDTVVLKKPPEKLKRYDVPLYMRADGSFVLHRVVKEKDNRYIMCGDNQWRLEYNICPEQILAVMQGFFRKDKYISCDNILYKVYYVSRTTALRIRVCAGVMKRRLVRRLIRNKKIKKF